jgi:hypothetical protein
VIGGWSSGNFFATQQGFLSIRLVSAVKHTYDEVLQHHRTQCYHVIECEATENSTSTGKNLDIIVGHVMR